jgi:methylmalonyl-CoA/ethylmalonyl-CoA epimerase
LGFVVPSISAAAESFAASMSTRWDGRVIHDPVQRVRVAFFSPADEQNPVVELVEPANDTSPVSYFLKKRGGGLHHICYEVDDLEPALREAKATGFCVVAPPAPAVAFEGRRIAWINRNRLLMELLERDDK